MSATTDISEKNYVFRLAPDFSVFDKAEKDFWQSHSVWSDDTSADKSWYHIYKADRLNFAGKVTIKTDAYRGMFSSDYPLAFSLDGANTTDPSYGVSVVENDYMSKYVYIVVVDECEKTKLPIAITATIPDPETNTDAEIYVTGVFF